MHIGLCPVICPFRIPLCIINITQLFLLYKCNNGAVMGLAGLFMGLNGAFVGIRGQPKKKGHFLELFQESDPIFLSSQTNKAIK